jgi:hypothetical protein
LSAKLVEHVPDLHAADVDFAEQHAPVFPLLQYQYDAGSNTLKHSERQPVVEIWFDQSIIVLI